MNLATRAATFFSISGQGFAVQETSFSLRTGHSGSEKTEWFSQTSLRCRSIESLRSSRMVTVTTQAQPGTLTSAASFDVPILSNSAKSNSPTTGSVSLSTHGGMFGITTFSPKFRIGQTLCEDTRWVSSTTIRALVSSGRWSTVHFVISVGEQVSSLSHLHSYQLPTMKLHSPGNKASTGSRIIAISGAGLGILGITGVSVSGKTSSESTVWISDTSIAERVAAGVSGSLLHAITSGMLVGSASIAQSFDVPALILEPPRGQVDLDVVSFYRVVGF